MAYHTLQTWRHALSYHGHTVEEEEGGGRTDIPLYSMASTYTLPRTLPACAGNVDSASVFYGWYERLDSGGWWIANNVLFCRFRTRHSLLPVTAFGPLLLRWYLLDTTLPTPRNTHGNICAFAGYLPGPACGIRFRCENAHSAHLPGFLWT